MLLQRFEQITRILRFDNRKTRTQRRAKDKLAPIRELWDSWVNIPSTFYNVGAFVTIDEQLVAFRGNCPFRQYIFSKPAKYGLKFWILCDSNTNYVWRIQSYIGKLPNKISEKKQDKHVVLDLIKGLKGIT